MKKQQIKQVDDDLKGKSVGSGLSITIPFDTGHYVKVEASVFVKADATDEEIDKAIETQTRLFWKLYEKQLETIKELKKRFVGESK